MVTEADLARFDAFVVPGPDGCLLWTGSLTYDGGYACFSVKGRNVLAHRWIYTQRVGEIPPKHQIDHTCHDPAVCPAGPCDHRRCVNPQHMSPTTARTNTLRGGGPAAVNSVKQHCHQNHPLEGDNLYVTKDGRRMCRACQREREKKHLSNNPTAGAERSRRYRERKRLSSADSASRTATR